MWDWPGSRCPSSRIDAPLRPALSTVLEPSLAVNAPVGDFAPQGRQRIELPAGAAQPHGLDARLGADHSQSGAAISFGIGRLAVEEEGTFARDYGIGAGRLVGPAARRKMRK